VRWQKAARLSPPREWVIMPTICRVA